MALSELLEPDRRWMRKALREAEHAVREDEVPVGAVVVHEGRVVGRDHNRVEQLGDPTAHAEVLAITAAADTLGHKHLAGCTLYATLEPCPMCAGALVLSRLDRLVFGAFDEKAGAASTLYDIPRDERLNHQTEVVSGVEAKRAEALLQDFFQKKRGERSSQL